MKEKDLMKKQIAENLKLARELSGLSQSQAAKVLEISRPTISEIEQGRRNVTGAEIKQFADVYGVDVGWVLSEQDESDEVSKKVQLAARQIGKMSKDEVDKLFKLLSTMKKNR